jgi:hypothetical protein
VTVCSYPPCDHEAAPYGGLCYGHRSQKMRGQELRPLLPFRGRRSEPLCSFEGCNKPNGGGGLCDGHRRQRARGKPLRKLGLPRGRPTKWRPREREGRDALRAP